MDRLKGGRARPPEMEGMGKDARFESVCLEHRADYRENVFSCQALTFLVLLHFVWVGSNEKCHQVCLQRH